MAEDIIANELSAKKITSEDITVNDINIVEYIKSKIAEVELDPVFKKWLETDSRLSDIGKNEISGYAKNADIPVDYTTSANVSSIIEEYDFAKATDIPTVDSFKDSFLSSSVKLSAINDNEISNYALSVDVDKAIEEKSLAPDAHLNLVDNENLRILSSDNQVLWQSASNVRYSIVAQTSALADMTITPYTLTSDSTTFQLPTSQTVVGKARDFLLDLSNSTDADAAIEFNGLDTSYSILVDSSTTRTEETTFKAGEHAIVAFTEIASNESMPCYLMYKKTIHDKES